MAKMVDFTYRKIERADSFLKINSFIHYELDTETTFIEQNLQYNVFMFLICGINGSVELYTRGETINKDFQKGSVVIFYSFLDYLPIDVSHWQTDGLERVKRIKLAPTVVEMLDQTRYFKEYPEHNPMFNEKVVMAMEKTTEKGLFRGFMHALITSNTLRIEKLRKYMIFKAQKTPRNLKF